MLLSSLLSSIIIPCAVAIDSFSNATVFQSDDTTGRVAYARSEELPTGEILAVWEDEKTAGREIYKSENQGFSWYPLGTVNPKDTKLRLKQPHLLSLNESFGSYEAGTVLMAVNAVGNMSTQIEIYASLDGGEVWDRVSTVATGGAPNITNGATPVWEPFLFYNNKRMLVYYSDQRDPNHGQIIVHQATSDLKTWGGVINDVVENAYTDRPGMPTVAKLPNGNFIITYENGQLDKNNKYSYPVYYRIANDPENFGTQVSQPLKAANTNRVAYGSPYVTWTPFSGADGMIIVSAARPGSIFVNEWLGNGVWTELNATAGRAYSREVRVPSTDINKLRFSAGAEYGQTGNTQILLTVMDFAKAWLDPRP